MRLWHNDVGDDCRGASRMEDTILNELIFIVEEAPEGGFTARALGASIFTEADKLSDLHAQVRDAVRCHFGDGEGPKVIQTLPRILS
jgi:hypothetical protein